MNAKTAERPETFGDFPWRCVLCYSLADILRSHGEVRACVCVFMLNLALVASYGSIAIHDSYMSRS